MKNPGILICFSLFWCITTSGITQNTISGQWTLIGFEDMLTKEKSYRPPELSKKQLTFTFEDNGQDGKLYGKTLINSFSCQYTILNSSITFENCGGTKVGEIGWGNDFWDKICRVNSFHITIDTLTLLWAKNTIMMIFIPSKKLEQWEKNNYR